MDRYGDVGRDVLYFGRSRPDTKISRRGLIKGAAATGALLLGGGAAYEYVVWQNSPANPDVWRRIVGGRENPHPEYGQLVWQGAFFVKPGAVFHEYPTWRRTSAEYPFTTTVEGNPVVHKMGDTIMVVKNALFFAQEALGWEKDTADVKPVGGAPYRISLDTVQFAVDLPGTPNRMGWLSLADVRFFNDSNQVMDAVPLDRIIQTPISNDSPWKGTADINGVPLHIGLVSR